MEGESRRLNVYNLEIVWVPCVVKLELKVGFSTLVWLVLVLSLKAKLSSTFHPLRKNTSTLAGVLLIVVSVTS